MNVLNTLLSRQMVTPDQIDEARRRRSSSHRTIHDTLLELDLIDEVNLATIMSETIKFPLVDLNEEKADLDVLPLINYSVAKEYSIFPIRLEKGRLVLAMSNPCDLLARDDVEIMTGLPVIPVVATYSQVIRKIEEYYQHGDTLDTILNTVVRSTRHTIDLEGEELTPDSELLKVENSPVVRLVDVIIYNAVKEKVSDIHIEPLENHVELRFRLDGVLRVMMKIPKRVQRHLASRIKIMAELDISECRRPQDGRIHMNFLDRRIDFRVSFMPTVFGEKIVMRVLDAVESRIDIDHLGLTPKALGMIKNFITKPQGMVLVTGPTGSGKTSTLYAALSVIKSKENNIMTIEDPVEYIHEGINQIQVNEKIGVTFANGLRSILRQDPDVILVGEIRDHETAEIAFRSSLTGHLVFSTLHTTSSTSAITRLRNIGIEPFLIASSMIGIVAQRLVRLICPTCKKPYVPEERILKKFRKFMPDQAMTFYRGEGCEECNYIGYRGRRALFEILPFNGTIRRLININASEEEILEAAKATGFNSLLEEGFALVIEGTTSLDEVESVVGCYDDLHMDHEHQPVKRAERSIEPRVIMERDAKVVFK